MAKSAVYDMVIIGAGPSGITAAIYAARRKLNFLVISMNIGGQVIATSDVENYTGYHFLSGPELVAKFKQHMQDYKIDVRLEQVIDIKKKGRIFEVKTRKAKYFTKTIIIACGKSPRKLNVPGEEELHNRGVSYCALCDGPLFKDKVVAVIGGGNSAMEAALFLEKYAKKIYILTINPELYGERIMLEKIKNGKKFTLIVNAKTTEIIGDKLVTGLKFIQDGKEKKIDLQGVFVEIGLITSCDFVKIVKKNKWGEIMIKRSTTTNKENLTNVPGIFAAGDCTDIPAKQIIVAAGEGAKAAIAAFDYLDRLEEKGEKK
jgi:alkyl hydroperoxide reductase subunit F